MLGKNSDAVTDQQIQVNDLLAIYNLGITDANAYNGDNVARVASVAADGANETTITLAAGKKFPLESGSKRFHVVPVEENVVAYVCSGSTLRRLVTPGTTSGSLSLSNSATRFCGSASSPVSSAPIIASGLSSCVFTYNDSDLQRNGLVQITLGLASEGETVSLYHQIHVNNTP